MFIELRSENRFDSSVGAQCPVIRGRTLRSYGATSRFDLAAYKYCAALRLRYKSASCRGGD